MAYSNPFLTTKPKLNWGSENIFAPGQFTKAGQLNQFGASLPGAEETGGEGFDWGGAVTAGLTGLSLATDAFGMANQPLGIETQAPGLEFSATGEPVYNTGRFYNQANSAQPQGVTAGEVVGSVGKGAAAGAQFGPVGAAIGGAVGLATSVFGGGRRAKKQREQRYRATASARVAQKNFNTASEAFDQTQAAQSDYLRRMNNMNRLYNLYA